MKFADSVFIIFQGTSIGSVNLVKYVCVIFNNTNIVLPSLIFEFLETPQATHLSFYLFRDSPSNCRRYPIPEVRPEEGFADHASLP